MVLSRVSKAYYIDRLIGVTETPMYYEIGKYRLNQNVTKKF